MEAFYVFCFFKQAAGFCQMARVAHIFWRDKIHYDSSIICFVLKQAGGRLTVRVEHISWTDKLHTQHFVVFYFETSRFRLTNGEGVAHSS